jgi:hypothetical protein
VAGRRDLLAVASGDDELVLGVSAPRRSTVPMYLETSSASLVLYPVCCCSVYGEPFHERPLRVCGSIGIDDWCFSGL